MDTNIKSTSRLIGDFLEINANILNDQFYSRYPKFLAKLIAKYYRSRLIKSAKKLKESNMILSIDNLTELFIYISSSYEGKYKNITNIIINSNTVHSIIDATVNVDNISALITIDTAQPNIELVCKLLIDEAISSFNISLTELKNKKMSLKRYNDIIDKLNNVLLCNMVDYILDSIVPYNGKETGYVKSN